MTTAYLDRLSEQLDDLAAQGRRRRARPVEVLDHSHVRRDGRVLLNVSSNDYLGLSHHPMLVERACEWGARLGVGATASRLICGTLEAHAAVERKLAAFKGGEAALILNSGYQANEAMLAALLMPEVAGRAPLVYVDRLAHASMHQGLKAAGVRQIRFRHNDMAHLESLLEARRDEPGPRFIVTESVFSMDGDRADLPTLCDLAERFDCFLYVDEAHATGVLGPEGRGLTCDPAVAGRIHMVMGTFGKALGGFGAYAVCSRPLREWLVNKAGGFIYSTALPPTVLGAIDAALDLVPTLRVERARVHAHADHLRGVLTAKGLDVCGSTTQIVPAVLGAEDAALAAMSALEDAGVLAVAIRPPTVPAGASRLRFAVSAAHSEADMDHLTAALERIA